MGMPNAKVIGPDGFTIDFYKACWSIIKLDVHNLMEESRIQKSILQALNSTFLTLIPKGIFADSPDEFRPITLCNFIYKIISKILDNRIKGILPLLTSHK